MTCNPAILAAARKGPCRLGPQPCFSPATRGLGAVLVVALFGVHTFQPIIGLVEVRQAADQAKPPHADSPQPEPVAPQPVVVSIHAWQWHQHGGELWPAFVFQPTISVGSGGSTQLTGSAVSHGGSPALPPSPPAPLILRWLAQPPGQPPALRLAWCRQICPIGPPLA